MKIINLLTERRIRLLSKKSIEFLIIDAESGKISAPKSRKKTTKETIKKFLELLKTE